MENPAVVSVSASRVLLVTWTPGRRKSKLALETPYEGVPAHLKVPLWSWLDVFLSNDADLVKDIGIEFRLTLPDPTVGFNHGQAVRLLADGVNGNEDFCLDLVEYVLETAFHPDNYRKPWEAAQGLEYTLATGNSAYKVREDGTGLEMRTTPEVQQQVQAVVDAATGSAGEHLANAWNEGYSRTPDPVKSYSESIKAVEVALAPHVSPQNAKQTLGTMVRDVKAKPIKWKSTLPDGGVGMVLSMMETLWDGQTSRHGGLHPTRNETTDEAQAAVHVAATLVQFGVSGAFTIA